VAVIADACSALLVLDALRRRGSVRTAAVTAGLVAANPVLLCVSGFHGNTDGIFIFLTLLAAWLLLDRDAPLLAGLALAAAGGIKLVPLILLPIFLAVLLRRRAGLAHFGIAFAAATAALWIPVVVRELPAVHRNVLGYAGQPVDWGVVLVARALGHPGRIVAFLAGPGRFLIILASVLPAALWAWRRPEQGYAAIGLALASFLVLAPAWAPQYLTWPVVFGYLWNRRVANTYSLVAASLLVSTYTHWSRGFPWDWARPQPLDRAGVLLGVAVWLVLIAWVLIGLGQARRQAAPRTEAVSPPRDARRRSAMAASAPGSRATAAAPAAQPPAPRFDMPRGRRLRPPFGHPRRRKHQPPGQGHRQSAPL
jgi:hypothetical protein